MDDSLAALRSFVETIIADDRDFKDLGGPVLHYGLFLRQILGSRRPAFQLQRDINSATQITSGAAITPWQAAACMEDRTRTAAFIRGAIRAIERALDQHSRRPLHLVEAGCGPLGTLILPLLAHFSSDDLVVSLIDLHRESIDCVETMLDHFGFLPRTRQLICGDATAVALDSPVQIVLTETMNSALGEEPQVAITRALLQQNQAAILVPQSIRVDLALLDIVAETQQFPMQVCDRTVIGPVFELNRRTALELREENGILPAASVKLPDYVIPGVVPCLTTTIQVFEDIQIRDYETPISCPVILQQAGQPQPEPGNIIRFAYRTGNTPGLIWHLID